MKIIKIIFGLLLASSLAASGQMISKEYPNIVLIMADDMGYECLSANGSISYNTPNIDRLAEKGIRFTQCYSQPLCTPSRVKIMTGQYNYRNYDTFGYLNPKDKTFGNVMKSAGYKTCIAGKWQLNGIYKDRMRPGGENTNRPYLFGFDEYCLWQLTKSGKQPNGRENSRYANPLIEQYGKVLSGLENQYGPDVFSDFICDFINKNREDKFFVYYPMVLPHHQRNMCTPVEHGAFASVNCSFISL